MQRAQSTDAGVIQAVAFGSFVHHFLLITQNSKGNTFFFFFSVDCFNRTGRTSVDNVHPVRSGTEAVVSYSWVGWLSPSLRIRDPVLSGFENPAAESSFCSLTYTRIFWGGRRKMEDTPVWFWWGFFVGKRLCLKALVAQTQKGERGFAGSSLSLWIFGVLYN